MEARAPVTARSVVTVTVPEQVFSLAGQLTVHSTTPLRCTGGVMPIAGGSVSICGGRSGMTGGSGGFWCGTPPAGTPWPRLVIVATACGVAMVTSCGEEMARPKVSSPSLVLSATTGTEIVCAVVPGGKVTVPACGWKSEPAEAVCETVEYVAVIVKPLGADSVTGNCAVVPSTTVGLPTDMVGGASSSTMVPVAVPLWSPPSTTVNVSS